MLFRSYGFGSHLSPGIALSRALTEAVQTRLTYISGSRDDIFRHEYQRNRDPDLIAAIWHEVTSTPSTIRFDARMSLSGDTFEDDVARLLDSVRAVGIKQVVVVDLTRPEVGLPVVKVVAPGLEGPGGHLPGARALQKMAAVAAEGVAQP